MQKTRKVIITRNTISWGMHTYGSDDVSRFEINHRISNRSELFSSARPGKGYINVKLCMVNMSKIDFVRHAICREKPRGTGARKIGARKTRDRKR
jgi:hypothetical protein